MGICYSSNSIIGPEQLSNTKKKEYNFVTTQLIKDTDDLYFEKTNNKCISVYEQLDNTKNKEYNFVTTCMIKDTDNIYIEKTNNKSIIFYYPFNSKLPIKGWIHHCILCSHRTGRIQLYSKLNNKNIYFQICNNCWKNKLNKKNKFYLEYLISKS